MKSIVLLLLMVCFSFMLLAGHASYGSGVKYEAENQKKSYIFDGHWMGP